MGATYRRGAGVQPQRDLTPAKAFLAKLPDLIPAKNNAGSADRSPGAGALLPRTVQPGAGTFADSDSFLFGDGCEDREDGFTKDSAGIEVLFRVASPVDPVRVQALKVRERFEHPLSGEAVEGPEEQNIETALGSILPHLLKTGAVGLCAGFLIGIFGDDFPTLGLAELPKLAAAGYPLSAVCAAGCCRRRVCRRGSRHGGRGRRGSLPGSIQASVGVSRFRAVPG